MPDGKPSTSAQGRGRRKKKAAPLGSLLDNPAFSGAENVVEYSIFGQSPTAPTEPAPPQPAEQATAPTEPDEEVGERSPTKPSAVSSKSDGRRRRTKGTRAEPTDAHKAVAHSWEESTLDLMLGAKKWTAVPVRLTEGLAEKITMRMVADSEATGKRMTQAHYVDAAFRRHLPSGIEGQVKLAESYLRSGRTGTTGRQSTYRLSPDIARRVRAMPMDMKKAGRSRTAVHVFSAAVQRLLDELEADGPLIWPEQSPDQDS